MDKAGAWLEFIVAGLATWRLAHLLAHEDGPFDLILRLRARAGESHWGRLMDCPYCLSLWFAVPAAAWLALRIDAAVADAVLLWLALSGGACLIEKCASALEGNAERREET